MLKNFSFWASSVDLPPDPYTDHRKADPSGRRTLRGESTLVGDRGQITEVYPATHSYTVQTETRGTLHGVGRLTQTPGDHTLLPVGTTVAINYCYGPPVIAGVLALSEVVADESAPASLTGVEGRGADDPLYSEKGAANYRSPGVPRDLSPHDWVQSSPLGNALATLDGGVNLIKSSDFAQIRTHLINDVVEIISQRFRHITGMGFSEYKDDGGRTSYVFRGGSDQTTECGSDQENWTIRFDLGTTGDLMRLELTQPDGASSFRVHVTPDGYAELFAAKGFHFANGADRTEMILGNTQSEAKGSAETTIGGRNIVKVRGESQHTVSANSTHNVGNDGVESIVRHFTKSVGGQAKYTFVGGNPVTATPLNDALNFEIVNGSWKVNIGDPVAGATPTALAGFNLQTFTGDIQLRVQTKGNVLLDTLLGNVDLATLAGDATLNTALGKANVNGTTVHLGSVATSLQNPVIRGTLHNTAMTTFLGANAAAWASLIGATSALIGSLPFALTWSAAAPLFGTWLSAVTAALTSQIAAHESLATALPTTLSPKVFTA